MKTSFVSFFLLLFSLFPHLLHSQCQTNVDFNTWRQEGLTINGNWTVAGGGTSVNQTINGDPTFYVSPDTFINVLIQGSFRVNTSFDDDYVGFVFGFNDPTGNSTNYDTYLFSWKNLTQTKFTTTGINTTAQEGMTLAKVSGNISSANDILLYLWGNLNTANKYEVLGTNYSNTAGWNSFTTYTFTLLYTPTRITIAIDNQVIFDVPGCYERGRFGFYNYSQSDVNYSNFSYKLISNFEPEDYQVCEGVRTKMNFTDSTCAGSASAISNIASWFWDFGDGTTSTQINPNHIYTTPGPKNVKLVITDINGCKDSVTKTIDVFPPPVVDLGPDINKCPNEYVQLDATIPGGSSYAWNPNTFLQGVGTPTPRSFSPTSISYSVVAVDTIGCFSKDTINVNVFPFVPAVLGNDIDCFGAANGIGIAGIQGTGPYDFSWRNSSGILLRNAVNTPIGVDTVTNLGPGTYTVTISDVHGCDTTLSFTINQPAAPLSLSLGTSTHILCNGAATGQFSVIAAGGTPSYRYSLNGGNFGPQINFTGLMAGTHTVVVEDANGCQETLQVMLTEPPALSANVDFQRNVPCAGDSTGYATILGAGGNPGYLFSINAGPFTTNNTFTGLWAGMHQVQISDANGCNAFVTVTITESPPLSVALANQVDVNCFGDNTGVITVAGNGGNPNYSYSLNGVNFQPSATFSNLAAGMYFVTIQDDSLCQTLSDTITLTQPIPLAVIDTFQSNVDCNGNSTGSVFLQGSGGHPGYMYSIDGVNFGANHVISNLAAGPYTVTIRDDSLCTATHAVTITEPPVLTGSIASLTDVDCNGNSTGEVTIRANGGTAPYQFAIDGVTFVTDSTFTGLAAGSYTITIQDDSSCLTTVPVTITEPTPLVEMLVGKTDVDCFGNANGSLTVSATGGTVPYQYALANVTTFQTSGTFSQLAPTNFFVVVQDSQLCTDTISVSITTPTGLTVNIDSVIHIGCNGDSTGKIGITPAGGTAPYEVSLDAGMTYGPIQLLTGLPAGNYPMLVRDAQGCIAGFSLSISEPSAVVGGLKWQRDVACFGDNTGYIALNASGGHGNFRFTVDNVNFSSDSVLFNLTAGAYTAVILDDSSCSVSVPVTISEPPLLVSSVQTLEHVSCFGLNDGRVSLTTNGGVTPYGFSLDGGTPSPDSTFSNFGPGNYTITVQDDSACTVDVPFVILEPDTLVLSLVEQINVACNGEATGQITLAHTGGWTPHVYSVNGGVFGPSPVFGGLSVGTYTFTVSDDSSCTDQLSVTVTEPPLLTVGLVDQTDIDCFGNLTGDFSVVGGGGTPAYSYSIDGINFGPDSAFAQLGAGLYTLTIRDDSSCTQTLDITLMEPDTLVVTARGIDVRCFEGMDGSVFADVVGGTTPYDISWDTDPVQVTQSVTGLARGLYAVSIIDAQGCTDTSSVFIDHPPLLELALVDSVHPYCDWANGSISVQASGGVSPNYQYIWDTDPPLAEQNITNLLEGEYTVVVADDNGCTDTLSVEIFNTPPADPNFFSEPSYADPILLSDATILFLNASQGASAYVWNFGDELGGSQEENPVYTYSQPGDYPVTLTAYNKYFECPADTTITLHIIPDGSLYFANAFSPNDDGINDEFFFVGEGMVQMEAQIFNRWGKQIALIQDPNTGWNGRYKNTGESVPEGVYVYVIRATFNNGTKVERSGTITLIR